MIHVIVMTRGFSKNKVLNIVNVELKGLKLQLIPHFVTLCFTYDDDLQTGTEDVWVRYL